MTRVIAKERPALRCVCQHAETPLLSDLHVARSLGPILLASAVGLLPFTVFSTFLVAIADDTGSSVVAVGSLRGLGGLSALAVGVALAPLLNRGSKDRAVAGALALLGASALLGAMGHFLSLILFCLLVGAATAVLNPALMTAAADRFAVAAAAGRAATLVTSTRSLTSVLAAPLVALPALLWGWQGNLIAVAAISLAVAALFLGRRSSQASDQAERGKRLGYLASFRALAMVAGVVPLFAVSLLATAAFMGYLVYLAAFFNERFGLAPGPFTLVWTLSGAAFFVGNLMAGRFTGSANPWISPERLLVLSLLVALFAIAGFFFAWALVMALLLTALLSVSHGTVAACVVSLLVRRCESLRGSALAINAAMISFGIFVGAALGGVGLAVAGFPGIGVLLGTLTLVAVAAALLLGPAVDDSGRAD